MLVADAP
jgi:hypothetical protein